LYETKFSPLPEGTTKERMVKRNRLPEATHFPGMRLMEEKDVKVVCKLLRTYLEKFDLAPIYSEVEVRHWFLHKGDDETRVVWAYVVEVYSLLPSIMLTV
jgi:glycylpeptide N-tetradecanoyltransferase